MSGVDLPTLRELALTASNSNRAALFLRVLPTCVEAGSGDESLIPPYLKALEQLGLKAAADDFVLRLPLEARKRFVQDGAIPEVVEDPTSRIGWSSCDRRMNANIMALRVRYPGAAESVESARAGIQEKFDLHFLPDRNPQIVACRPVWPPCWLRGIADHRAAAVGRVPLAPPQAIPLPLLFEGLGFGWELLHAFRSTADGFLGATAVVYVLEPSIEALAMAMHLQDFREIFSAPRVRFFVGPTAEEDWKQFLLKDASWPLGNRIADLHLLPCPEAPRLEAIQKEVHVQRLTRAGLFRQRIEDRNANRHFEFWAYRFLEAVGQDGTAVANNSLRIIVLTSAYTTYLQYSARDCAQALQSLGHQVQLLIDPSHHQFLDNGDLLAAQFDFDPDLILTISRMRYEMTDRLHPSIPSVCWDQDSLPWVFPPERAKDFGPLDFLMGYEAFHAPSSKGWPEHHCLPCNLAGSQWTYSNLPIDDNELAPYQCDVSYVSHASATVEEELESVRGWLKDARLREVLDDAVTSLIPLWRATVTPPEPMAVFAFDAFARAGCPSPSFDEFNEVVRCLRRLGDRVFRHTALEWVADWADRTGRKFRLYGNGWEKHPRLSRYAVGAAANGEELRRIHQASAINLQLMVCGFLHQRACDCLLAGGFVLTRWALADIIGPAMRELVSLLDRCGVQSEADFASLTNPTAKEQIARVLGDGFRADPRYLMPEHLAFWRKCVQHPFAEEVVPYFTRISFRSADEFAERAEHFLADAENRRRISRQQREYVLREYSYRRRMADMLVFIRQGLAIDAKQTATITG